MTTTPITTTDIEPGALLLDKYRVERVLGEGGMGIVVEATHLELDQPVAIKLLARHAGREEEMLARFRNEARIVARLPDEHIVRALDAGRTEGGDAYLVMELLTGRDLDAELDARGRLAIPEAIDYVLQACEGLAAAHAVGLVHRDLKPANLFLTRSRQGDALVKVVDFGIATCLPGVRIPATDREPELVGTPAYMAPEQFNPVAEADARCDQYALASVLFELIAGTSPFFGEDAEQLAVRVVTEEAPRLAARAPGVPAALDAAMARALAKDPEARFADLGELARAIAPFGRQPEASASAERVAAALGAGTTGAPPRRVRPLRLIATVAAVVVVGLAALLVPVAPRVAAGEDRPAAPAPPIVAPAAPPAVHPAATSAVAEVPRAVAAAPAPSSAPSARSSAPRDRPASPRSRQHAVRSYSPREVFGARP